MSTKIDCVIYLKSKLENEFMKAFTATLRKHPGHKIIERLALTAEEISDWISLPGFSLGPNRVSVKFILW